MAGQDGRRDDAARFDIGRYAERATMRREFADMIEDELRALASRHQRKVLLDDAACFPGRWCLMTGTAHGCCWPKGLPGAVRVTSQRQRGTDVSDNAHGQPHARLPVTAISRAIWRVWDMSCKQRCPTYEPKED
jgi:hypothetical protein